MKRTQFAGVAGLAFAGLLLASCYDAATSVRSVPYVPAFAAVPGPPVLNQRNGTIGFTGTDIRKGFNPTNPHTGDAIIATFVWQGTSTNVITSVVDQLTNGTPVGNTYNLVEFKSSGGVSMATYVALNVQNFPDPNVDASGNPDQDKVLVVVATLSQSITNGGVMISSYRGVATASALTEHASAGGSGSTTTPVSTGPITPGDQSLIYTATASMPNAAVDPPAGFAEVNFLSNPDAKLLGQWKVQSGSGTVDPTWTWYFTQPTTWLLTNIALKPNGGGGPTTGDLTATTSTTGSSIDPDGYTVTVDGVANQAIGVNGSVTFTALTSGNHTVALNGVASNCTVGGSNPRTETVVAGTTTTTAFSITCADVPPPNGNLSISANTTGSDLDPDGYTVTVDGSAPQAIGINGSVTFNGLSAGDHSVSLSGVAANCSISGGNPRTISVPAGGTATTTFAVSCVGTPSNHDPVVNAGADETVLLGLLFTENWSFTDPDNGPWSFTIDWGDGTYSSGTKTTAGSFSNGHTYGGLLLGKFTIRITVTDSQGATHTDTKLVTVVLF